MILKNLLNRYKERLNFPLDDVDINQIIIYLNNGQLKKLQFEYGNFILDACLEWAEIKEDYELCSAIEKFKKEIKRWN